jgi:predicted nucleotidyltransferase
MHQLTDEQLATIISWAKKTPDVQAVFLSGKRARGTAEPDSNVELALSITGQDPLRRLATFLSRRRAWRGELEAALGLAVQLERARADSAPEGGYVELWERP